MWHRQEHLLTNALEVINKYDTLKCAAARGKYNISIFRPRIRAFPQTALRNSGIYFRHVWRTWQIFSDEPTSRERFVYVIV